MDFQPMLQTNQTIRSEELFIVIFAETAYVDASSIG